MSGQSFNFAIVHGIFSSLGTAVGFRYIYNTPRAQKPLGVPRLAQIGQDHTPGLFLGM